MTRTPAMDRLDAVGVDAVCEEIANGQTMTAIAERVQVSIGSLIAWISADSERSARTREARVSAARFWDEKAETRLDEAVTSHDLAKAKELAFHYRWRASKIAPREYGDRLDLNHSGEVAMRQIPDEQLDARLKALLAATSGEP